MLCVDIAEMIPVPNFSLQIYIKVLTISSVSFGNSKWLPGVSGSKGETNGATLKNCSTGSADSVLCDPVILESTFIKR